MMLAQKIAYFEMTELPGKLMFVCEKRKASLQVSACIEMWSCGHVKGSPERFWACRGCTLGAQHAGASEATLSPLYATSICGRCEGTGARLIHGHICVSCYNRELEHRKGKNAKGNRPVMHPDLFRVSLRYATGGRVKVKSLERATGPHELVVAALRDEPEQVTFCMMINRPAAIRQGDLFS